MSGALGSVMKPILVGLLLVVGASSVAAQKPAPNRHAKKKPNFGEGYELKDRSAHRPRVVETPVVRTVIAHPTGRDLRDKVGDLEYCWLKLPPARRIASAAMLHVTVEAAGMVTAASVEGALPAGVERCITAAAGRWRFPVAETRAELEHAIMLTTH